MLSLHRHWCGLFFGLSLLLVQGCAASDPSAAEADAEGVLSELEPGLDTVDLNDPGPSPAPSVLGERRAPPPPVCLVQPDPCVWLELSDAGPGLGGVRWRLGGIHLTPDALLPRVTLLRFSDRAELELQPAFEADGSAFYAEASAAPLVSKSARQDPTSPARLALPPAFPRCRDMYVAVVEDTALGAQYSNPVTLPDCAVER